ncbi:golgi SNAP receptor complex member 2 [Pelomyxa schiedti]|nr:golgi SNAP receptor complex member 2 [Pelomyxa schiedti]
MSGVTVPSTSSAADRLKALHTQGIKLVVDIRAELEALPQSSEDTSPDQPGGSTATNTTTTAAPTTNGDKGATGDASTTAVATAGDKISSDIEALASLVSQMQRELQQATAPAPPPAPGAPASPPACSIPRPESWRVRVANLGEECRSLRDSFEREMTKRQRAMERDQLLRDSSSSGGGGPKSHARKWYLYEESRSVTSSRAIAADIEETGRAVEEEVRRQNDVMMGSTRKLTGMRGVLGSTTSVMHRFANRVAGDRYLAFGGIVTALVGRHAGDKVKCKKINSESGCGWPVDWHANQTTLTSLHI